MGRRQRTARSCPSDADVFQMNDWVRSPLPVKRRTTCALEAHFFVEAQCLSVLLIDIGCHFGVTGEAVTNECSAIARPAESGVNEQGLHMSVVDEHKCQWVIVGIHSEPERNFWQKVANHLIDGLAILLGKKVMSSINRAAPDINSTFALIRTGISNSSHFLIISTATRRSSPAMKTANSGVAFCWWYDMSFQCPLRVGRRRAPSASPPGTVTGHSRPSTLASPDGRSGTSRGLW